MGIGSFLSGHGKPARSREGHGQMKIHIIGVGGVGGYYAGLLALNGADVSVVASCPDKGDFLRHHGLKVIDRDRTFHTRQFQVLDSIGEIAGFRIILLAVKTYHLADIVRQLAPVVSEKTRIITLQNGINADQCIAPGLKSCRVFPGLTWVLSTLVAPGTVEQKADKPCIRFGCRDPGDWSEVLHLAGQLREQGLPVIASEDIVMDLWKKYLWLVNFAGTSGTLVKMGKALGVETPVHSFFYRAIQAG